MPGALSVEFPLHSWRRLTTLWREKLRLTAVLNVLFWGFYLFLSRHALLPVHTLPMTWLDRWAGFQPHLWAWVYESNFLLGGVFPWLIVSREELRRYAAGFALLSVVCFVVFALFPVASPRPANLEASPFLIFITRVDGPLNAFPSLHAGFVIYSLAWARRLSGRRLNLWVASLLLAWAALILFATLATKQHYALDLLAGGLIGWAAAWVTFSKPKNSSPIAVGSLTPCKPVKNSVETRQKQG
jgi:membrane-associated phospholipid phosphatase